MAKEEDRIEAGKKSFAEIEKKIGPFMPKMKVREGARRSEWRSDNAGATDNRGAPRRKGG